MFGIQMTCQWLGNCPRKNDYCYIHMCYSKVQIARFQRTPAKCLSHQFQCWTNLQSCLICHCLSSSWIRTVCGYINTYFTDHVSHCLKPASCKQNLIREIIEIWTINWKYLLSHIIQAEREEMLNKRFLSLWLIVGFFSIKCSLSWYFLGVDFWQTN